MRRALPFALFVLLPMAAGCESAETKCARARDEVDGAWGGYIASLDSALVEARETERINKAKVAQAEQRLSGPIKSGADARYERASNAWMRAFRAGLHKACGADEECSRLKQEVVDAAALIEDFEERVPLAHAARAASTATVQEAQAAADAVIIHAEYPIVKAAQRATAGMVELCADLPPLDEAL